MSKDTHKLRIIGNKVAIPIRSGRTILLGGYLESDNVFHIYEDELVANSELSDRDIQQIKVLVELEPYIMID